MEKPSLRKDVATNVVAIQFILRGGWAVFLVTTVQGVGCRFSRGRLVRCLCRTELPTELSRPWTFSDSLRLGANPR